MAIPPRVTREQVDKAIEAITKRRRDMNDPSRYRLSDDPGEVIDYLQMFTPNNMSDVDKQADAEDALILTIYESQEWRRRDIWVLEYAKTLNMDLKKFGKPLGLNHRQSVLDRIDRGKGVLGPLKEASEKEVRKVRKAQEPSIVPAPREPTARDLAPSRAEPLPPDLQQEWLTRNHPALRAVAAVILAHQNLVNEDTDPDAADSLITIRRDHKEGVCSVGMYTTIEWAIEELKVLDRVAALPERHALVVAFADFAKLQRGYDAAKAKHD